MKCISHFIDLTGRSWLESEVSGAVWSGAEDTGAGDGGAVRQRACNLPSRRVTPGPNRLLLTLAARDAGVSLVMAGTCPRSADAGDLLVARACPRSV